MQAITEATAAYENWLGRQVHLLPDDLALKHAHMREVEFLFFRATFYRFAQRWPEFLPDLNAAPRVVAVGDLHVENFGTWRDAEGRLTWGVNDFDEASEAPYTLDLVRLAASALLAIQANRLELKPSAAVAALNAGYREAIDGDGRPWILEEGQDWLRGLAYAKERNPTKFWGKLDALPDPAQPPPAALASALMQALPAGTGDVRIVHRVAGLGSLGRERYVALGRWHGAHVAREAKPVAVSARHWASKTPNPPANQSQQCWQRAVRVPDPFLAIRDGWLMRRLAPFSSRIELSSLAIRSPRGAWFRCMLPISPGPMRTKCPARCPPWAADRHDQRARDLRCRCHPFRHAGASRGGAQRPGGAAVPGR